MDARVKNEGARRRRRGYTRVSPKHQVTIPADALARAGVRIGDELRVEAREGGEIVLVPVGDPLDRYAGALTGHFSAGYLDDLRDEWERSS
jgi:AbrB family looped-hinge helix DNA binding protein